MYFKNLVFFIAGDSLESIEEWADPLLIFHNQFFRPKWQSLLFRNKIFLRAEEYWYTSINSQVSKKLTPQVSSWFSTTKGIDCEEMTRDWADPTSSGHSSYLQTFDARWKRVFPVAVSGLQHF